MTRHLLAIFGCFSVAVAECAKGQTRDGPRPSAARLAAAIEEFSTRAMDAKLSPALGVAIVMDGETIYNRAFGMADVTSSILADTSTLWFIGPTSMSFTGFAIARLATEGKVDVKARITTLLPRAKWPTPSFSYHSKPDQLTLADFLTHSHGIDGRMNAVVVNSALTGIVPESRWPEILSYGGLHDSRAIIVSNLGYNVAAMVIDAVHPEGWRSYLQKNVFDPAGMRETYHRVSGLDSLRFAMPHDMKKDFKFVTVPFRRSDATMNAADGHLSTLGDLARWVTVNMQDGMIDGRQVFSAEAMQLAHRQLAQHSLETNLTRGPFDRSGWGMGWDVGSYNGEVMISRIGSFDTFTSHLSYLPARRIGVVAQSTAKSAEDLTDAIAAYAYDLEAGRSDARARADSMLAALVTNRSEIPDRLAASERLSAERNKPFSRPLASFTGTYSHPAYGDIVWTERDGKLWYSFGAYSGPATVENAERDRVRIVLAGSGMSAEFSFDGDVATQVFVGGGMLFKRSTR